MAVPSKTTAFSPELASSWAEARFLLMGDEGEVSTTLSRRGCRGRKSDDGGGDGFGLGP
jgi:hypothetical protein